MGRAAKCYEVRRPASLKHLTMLSRLEASGQGSCSREPHPQGLFFHLPLLPREKHPQAQQSRNSSLKLSSTSNRGMNLKTFKSQPCHLTVEQWRDAADGVLLKGFKGFYYLMVLKAGGHFNLFLAKPSDTLIPNPPLALNCGCRYSNQAHWHSWQSFESAEQIVAALARILYAIERGTPIKLANSARFPT